MDSILKARAQKIKLVIFDVDGVMTDGSLFIGDDGQEYKMFNTQDGLGMRLLKKSGIKLAIITGRNSNSVLIKKIAHFITEKIAGYGAVREACDFIMKAQDTYGKVIAPYLK